MVMPGSFSAVSALLRQHWRFQLAVKLSTPLNLLKRKPFTSCFFQAASSCGTGDTRTSGVRLLPGQQLTASVHWPVCARADYNLRSTFSGALDSFCSGTAICDTFSPGDIC